MLDIRSGSTNVSSYAETDTCSTSLPLHPLRELTGIVFFPNSPTSRFCVTFINVHKKKSKCVYEKKCKKHKAPPFVNLPVLMQRLGKIIKGHFYIFSYNRISYPNPKTG